MTGFGPAQVALPASLKSTGEHASYTRQGTTTRSEHALGMQLSSYTSVVCIHGLYFYSTAIGSPWDPCWAFFALALFFFSSSYLYHSSLRS